MPQEGHRPLQAAGLLDQLPVRVLVQDLVAPELVQVAAPVVQDLTVGAAPGHGPDGDRAVAGDEVVQLYLKFPAVKGAPRIALRAFERVHLEPGASKMVHFDLKPRDLGMVTEVGNPIVAEGDYTLSIGGGQPDTGAPVASGHFHIDGQLALTE